MYMCLGFHLVVILHDHDFVNSRDSFPLTPSPFHNIGCFFAASLAVRPHSRSHMFERLMFIYTYIGLVKDTLG